MSDGDPVGYASDTHHQSEALEYEDDHACIGCLDAIVQSTSTRKMLKGFEKFLVDAAGLEPATPCM